MADAKRDQNFVPTLLGVSNADGVTPVAVYADPVTHRLLVDLPTGTGTVTSVSVVSANGFAGTVATATSTPAITLSTTITGVLYGNGTAISALTIGSGLSLVGSTLSTTGGSGTVTNTGGALTANSVVLGAGSADVKVVSGIVTDGVSQLTLGVNATTLGKVKMFGNTSGDVTLQPTAAAGTATVQTLPATTGTLVNRVTTGNGVSATNTDGALSFTLGAITPTTVNGNTFTTGSSTYTGTAGQTYTFPTTTATLARTDAANTFTGASTATSWVLTTPTITTSIVPTSNDGAALGSTTNQFSDLFLASGGVINFNNGNITLTHSAGLLSLAGGGMAFGGGNLSSIGSVGLTGSRITKLWATDIESTNMPTVGGTAILTSLTAPQFTTIELGNASDTTLSRTAAGIIAVEGYVLNGYATTATAAGTTTLSITDATTQFFTGSSTQTVKLPTTSVVVGQPYTIVNNSTGNVTVQSSGANTIQILGAGMSATFTAIVATPTTAANWSCALTSSSGQNIAQTASANAATVNLAYVTNTITNNSAATLTVTLPTAGAIDGELRTVRILDFSAVAQTITWVNTENSTVTAPTTSNGSTTLPVTAGFQYNSATSKWRCIASA